MIFYYVFFIAGCLIGFFSLLVLIEQFQILSILNQLKVSHISEINESGVYEINGVIESDDDVELSIKYGKESLDDIVYCIVDEQYMYNKDVPGRDYTRKEWKQIQNKTLSVPFYINDGTDRIKIEPEHLIFYIVPLIEKFQDEINITDPGDYPEGYIGRYFKIKGIKKGQKVFCFGEVNLTNEGITMGNSVNKAQINVVSKADHKMTIYTIIFKIILFIAVDAGFLYWLNVYLYPELLK